MVKIVDNYTLTEAIGQGQYGKVYKATHVDTKMNVAIKCIRVDKFIEIGKLTECTRNEVETLMLIQDNINVIKFVEMIKTARNIYLVYEYCQGGNLEQEMRRAKFFPEKKALLYFKQLLNAFRALSAHNILHRDIKPDNILIKSGHLKLADFGFCKRMASPDDLTQTVLGSPVYMAPEVLNGDLYNSKADIWSLGVVLFEMLFGYCPFNEGSMADFLHHIDNFRVTIPQDINPISSITEGLLRRLLEKDHFRRISWEDLFYEYDVTEYGVLTRKEKGFEYDLMKLMKKNSYNQPPPEPTKPKATFKFNWDRIADGKSSVKSDELDEFQKQGDVDRIIGLKRKLKEFSNEHAKCYLASVAMTDVVKKRQSEQTDAIAYYLCATVRDSLQTLRTNLEQFRMGNVAQLQANPTEYDEVRRLLAVLAEEHHGIVPKLDSLRMLAIGGGLNKESLSKADSRRKHIEQYLKDVVAKYPHCQSFEEGYDMDKVVTAHLVRVFAGLNFQKEREPANVLDTMDKLKLVKLLHQRRRDLEI